MVRNLIMVGIGGMLGSLLRYVIALLIKTPNFPWATFAVNFIGSFIIAVVLGISLKNQEFNQNWKLFFSTGICGGFTTFSTFSVECVQLLQQQRYGTFAGYVLLSILAGMAATFGGFYLTTHIIE